MNLFFYKKYYIHPTKLSEEEYKLLREGSVKDVMLLIGDWLCRVPLGLLRLRLVMTLRLVFARFGTNRSNLLWVQVVHLCITCGRLPFIFTKTPMRQPQKY
jgi:hypothetical protein